MVILKKKVAGLTENALRNFVLQARRAVGVRGQVNVLVTGSAAVRSLNRQFRRQNKPTDVLSFPFVSSLSDPRQSAKVAGDVAISADIARQNAFCLGHSALEEVKILALHGILHLAGFDHERDNGQMARKEARLRQLLGLPAGLIERAHPENRRSSKVRRATGARRMT